MQTGELDFQLVKQTTEWRAPARYDQVLEVSVATKHLGNTSFTLATEFRIAGEKRVIVTVETIYVHVDHHTLQKSPLPAPLRAAMERGATNVTIDHAAYL
jgi:acyl-CoA thioester hydrolase